MGAYEFSWGGVEVHSLLIVESILDCTHGIHPLVHFNDVIIAGEDLKASQYNLASEIREAELSGAQLLDAEFAKKFLLESKKLRDEYGEFTEKISKTNFSALTNDELAQYYEELYDLAVRIGTDYYISQPEYLKAADAKLKQILPALQKSFGKAETETRVELYRGKSLLKMALRDAMARMKPGEEFVGIAHNDEEFIKMEPIALRQYLRHIVKNNITERIIMPKGSRMYEGARTTQYRTIDKKFLGNMLLWVYADRVFLIITGEKQVGVMITSKGFADTYRQQFELYWKQAKPAKETFSD